MTRKQGAGRSVSEGGGAPPSMTDEVRQERLPHAELMGRTQEQLLETLPLILDTLLEQARAGSLPHMKLLLELCGLDKGKLAPQEPAKREKTLEEILTEQWRNEPLFAPGLK